MSRQKINSLASKRNCSRRSPQAVYLVGGVRNHQPLQAIAPVSAYPGAWQAVQFGEAIALNGVAGKQQVIAVQAAYMEVLAGKGDPRTGHILQP